MHAVKRSAPIQKQTIRIEPSKLVKRRRLEAWALERQKYHEEVEQEEKQKLQKKKDAVKEQVAKGKKRAKIKTAAHQQELEAESGEDVDSEEEEETPPATSLPAPSASIYALITFLKAVGPGKRVDSAAILRATGTDFEKDAALAESLSANPRVNVKCKSPLQVTYRPPYGVSSATKLRALLMVRLPAGDLRTEDGRKATAVHEKDLADCYPGVESDLQLLLAKGHVRTAIDTRTGDKFRLFFNATGVANKPHRIASETVTAPASKPTVVQERIGNMLNAEEGSVADLFG